MKLLLLQDRERARGRTRFPDFLAYLLFAIFPPKKISTMGRLGWEQPDPLRALRNHGRSGLLRTRTNQGGGSLWRAIPAGRFSRLLRPHRLSHSRPPTSAVPMPQAP